MVTHKIPFIHSKRHLLGYLESPSGSKEITLNDSPLNYDYIEIIFVKSGSEGAFVNKIISKDNVSVGSGDTLSFSAYNNNTYHFYAECGFTQNKKFYVATYSCAGWTMSKMYVVGINV